MRYLTPVFPKVYVCYQKYDHCEHFAEKLKSLKIRFKISCKLSRVISLIDLLLIEVGSFILTPIKAKIVLSTFHCSSNIRPNKKFVFDPVD